MHSYILHILKRFRKAVQSYMLMLYGSEFFPPTTALFN